LIRVRQIYIMYCFKILRIGCGTLKILIVDDEDALLQQAKIFLEQLDQDLEIDTAVSPKDALKLLKSGNYDGVVSDYQMPEIDGLDFLKILRQEKNIDIPFIMFTGKGREEVAMKALNMGADRYLQKGGDPRTQYGVLAQAIEQEVTHHKTKKRNKELLRDLDETFNTIDNPILLLDNNHHILRVNKAAERFFDKKREKLVGGPCHKFTHNMDSPLEKCPLKKSIDTKQMEEMKFYDEDKNRYFIARTNPIMDDDGEIKKFIHQEIDITDIRSKRHLYSGH